MKEKVFKNLHIKNNCEIFDTPRGAYYQIGCAENGLSEKFIFCHIWKKRESQMGLKPSKIPSAFAAPLHAANYAFQDPGGFTPPGD